VVFCPNLRIYLYDSAREQLLEAIGAERKTLVRFSADEGAGGHCEGTARRLFHQRVYDWLDETLAPATA
jgi:hypothetical protein